MNQNNEQPQNKKNKFWIPNIMSGIIGGIISVLLVSFLYTSDIIPMKVTKDNANSSLTTEQDVDSAVSGPITDVSNTPTNLDQLSKAIVGVVNLKQQSIGTPSEEAGTGSGIIYKREDGKAYIITNNHVVQGAEEVEVDLNNDERLKAKVLGTDALNDLAVLEVDGKHVEHVADLGSSGELQVGDTVIAIGNPLGINFAGSVTKGIVSGLDRSIEVDTNGDRQTDWITEVIQTDAAINPGNSGGALVNANGEVIGINSMKIAQQAVEGISFAIPIDTALPIVEQLETNGEIERPFIGISTVDINQVPQQFLDKVTIPDNSDGGMVVANVQEQSPAEEAGLKEFDLITKINDQEITSLLDLRKYMYSETAIGDTVTIEVYRNNKQQTVQLKLEDRKE